MDIAELQAWGYFLLTGFMVFILYMYIYHLYSSQKNGTKDYEKYSNIALNDDISSDPLEKRDDESSKDKNKDAK